MTGPRVGLGPRSVNLTPPPEQEVPLDPQLHEQAFVQAAPVDPPGRHHAPANKFAPTGWRQRVSVEFDYQVPSGQWCRLRRLDKVDLFKLRILDHMDNLLPQLIDVGDDQQQQAKVQQAIQKNMNLVDDMYNVIDIVTMAACVRPMVTDDKSKTNYGTAEDWENPDFIATVHIDDVIIEDKQAIFQASFKGDVDALKSAAEQEVRVGDLPASPGVPLPTQPTT